MNEIVSTAAPSLIEKIGQRYSVDANKLLPTLKQTAFQSKKEVSNAEMMALLIVADQYKLNPFTKELYAYPDKGKIVPVVSVDGWSRIINGHPQMDGMRFTYSDEMVEMPGGKQCPTWCECEIFRKDRTQTISVREYLDEVYRGPIINSSGQSKDGPWQSHTKRMLRHKTLIQAARITFGFSGIFDEDEAHRIIQGEAIDITPPSRQDFKGTDDEAPQDEPPTFDADEILLVIHDEFGEQGPTLLSPAEFADDICRMITETDLRANLTALEEHNAESIDALGSGSDSELRRAVNECLNAQKSKLEAEMNQPTDDGPVI